MKQLHANSARADCAACENAVRRALTDMELGGHIITTRQLPAVIAVTFRPRSPLTRSQVDELALKTAYHIDRNPVSIAQVGASVTVEIPAAVQIIVAARRLEGVGVAVPLGLTASSVEPEGIDFDEQPHLLAVGPTGSGKTVAARAVAYHLARQNDPRALRMAVFCTQAKAVQDWQLLADLPHCDGVVTEIGETLAALRYYQALVNAHPDGVHRVLFIDDLPNLVSRAVQGSKPEIVATLADLVAQGRSSRTHVVAGTQTLGKAATGDAAIAANITARLVFRTADAAGAARAVGRSGSSAHLLTGRGSAVFVTDNSQANLRVSPVHNSDLEALAGASPVQRRPWLVQALVQGPVQGPVQEDPRSFSPLPAENDESTLALVQTVQGYLPPGPALTDADRARVRACVERNLSANAAIPLLWGLHKNSRTLPWWQESVRSL